MACITTRYFNINKILLFILGLWPYQRSKLVRFQMILFFVILASSIMFQFTALLTAKCASNFIIQILSYASCSLSFIIAYNSFCINRQSLRYIWEQLEYTCNQLKDEKEISIIEKYGRSAKSFTIKFTMTFMSGAFYLTTFPITQNILRTLLRIKDFQISRAMQIQAEYFIDEEKYSNVILIHMSLAFCIGVTILVGTTTTLAAYLKHFCGMFTIASYRIEQAMMSKTQKASLEDNIIVYKKMIYAVYIHRKAIKLSEFLISSFEGSCFLLIIVGVASLSFNLMRIFHVAFDNTEELVVHIIFALCILLYMFVVNSVGQEIIDHNIQVFATAYNVRWYETPLRVQRLILFLLQRGSKPFGLYVGSLFVASFECFAKLASASVSYFTVMYSMQK